MAQGFQVFNAQGVLVCDITDRLPKVIKSGVINNLEAGGSVNISVPGIRPNDSWMVCMTGQVVVQIYNDYFKCTRTDRYYDPPPAVVETAELYYTVINQ